MMIYALLTACTGSDDSAKETGATDSETGTDTETGTTETDTDSGTTETDTDSGTAATVSFAADVWPVLEANCAGCHADDSYHPGLLLGDATQAYTSLLTDLPDSGSGAYVVPGNPADSYAFEKISVDPPSAGTIMPPAGMMDSAALATVETWILEGALDN